MAAGNPILQRKTLNLISDCLKTHNVEYMLI